MKLRTDKSHVWEFDYGVREPVFDALEHISEFTSKDCVTGLGVYVNNNPYMLELFVTVEFATGHRDVESCLELVESKFAEAGGKRRSDITVHDLNLSQLDRRFNYSGLTDSHSAENLRVGTVRVHDVERAFPFVFASKDQLRSKGFSMMPFTPRDRVFLSHQSDRKPQVVELQQHFSSHDIQCWLDQDAIKVGDLLYEEIDRGISQSSAVVFWISRGFVESGWCKYEIDNFINSVAVKGHANVRLFSVIDHDVPVDRIPPRLRQVKYLTYQDGQTVRQVARDLIPDVKSFFDSREV